MVALAGAVLLVGVSVFFFGGPTQRALGDRVLPPPGGGSSGIDAGGVVDGDDCHDQDWCDEPEDNWIPLCGFAWGETSEGTGMGAGWVSFSSRDCDTNEDGVFNDGVAGCPSSGTAYEYGVYIDPENGRNNLIGSAWSSNLGWLAFGGLSDFPTEAASGNQAVDAKIGDFGALQGWARFCEGTADGTCERSRARTDGWDGWLSLKSTTPGRNYGVTVSNFKFQNYSWGGPVVGWLKWNSSETKGVRYCDQSLGVTLDAEPNNGPAPLSVTLTATPEGIMQDGDEYRFICGNGDTWQNNWQLEDNTYNQVCNYGLQGRTFEPQVELRRNSLTATGTDMVVTDQVITVPLTCTLNPEIVHLNNQTDLTVSVNSPVVGATYTYTFTYDGAADPTPIVDGPSVQVGKTYNTLGRKQILVHVVESPSGATGDCEVNPTVIVRPQIIEI